MNLPAAEDVYVPWSSNNTSGDYVCDAVEVVNPTDDPLPEDFWLVKMLFANLEQALT